MQSNTQKEGKIANKYKFSTSQVWLAAVRNKSNENGKDEKTVAKITDYWKTEWMKE
jgi:hypothetical protein